MLESRTRDLSSSLWQRVSLSRLLTAAVLVTTLVASEAAAVSTPSKEQQLIGICKTYQVMYDAAKNALKRSGLVTKRKSEIGSVFQGELSVENWVGTLESLSTDSGGDATVTIRLSEGVTIWTIGAGKINIGSALWDQVAEFEEGQKVAFSGNFFRGEKHFLKETSFTERGAMQEPEFSFQFSTIRPLP